jgi:hypothetical protein
MSFASSAAPLCVCVPATAQLLLPTGNGWAQRRQLAELAPQLPQVEGCRRRHRGRRHDDTIDRRLPGRGHRIHEAKHFRRQGSGEQATLPVGRPLGIVQLQVHRVDDEQAILRPPGLGALAQQEILERPHSQRVEPRVDAARIRIEQRPLHRSESRVDALGDVMKAMKPPCRVQVHGRVADEFRQAPARHPAREVHLEKAVLRVDKPGCEGDVSARMSGDRHGAQRIAFDHGLALETRCRPLAVDHGQAAAHGKIEGRHAYQQ